MASLQDCADSITTAAGWKKAVPDDKGHFHFVLEGDLTMDLFSPDGRVAVFYSVLSALPQGEQDCDALLQKCTGRVVGGYRKRRSVLSLDGDALALHRMVPLTGLEAMPGHAKDFLNDCAWWKAQISGGTQPSPFSFGFPGTGSTVWGMGR